MGWLYLITAVCGLLWWLVHRKLDVMLKYEFENRTDGGIVGFKDYKQAKHHDHWKNLFSTWNRGLMILFAITLSLSITLSMRN